MRRGSGVRGMVWALVVALVACLGVSGCSLGNPEAPYVGYWEYDEAEVDGEDMDDTVDLMEELDLHLILHLEEGGDGEFDVFGSVMDVEWDAEKGTISVDGSSDADLVLEDGKLTIREDDDNYFTFKKSDDDLDDTIDDDKDTYKQYESLMGSSSSGSSSTDVSDLLGNTSSGDDSSSSTVVSLDLGDLDDDSTGETVNAFSSPITVVDDDKLQVTITGSGTNYWGEAGYYFEIVNKTSQEITFDASYDECTVDGTAQDFGLACEVDAGQTATDFGYFYDVSSVGDLKNVHLSFVAYYETNNIATEQMGTYEVDIP